MDPSLIHDLEKLGAGAGVIVVLLMLRLLVLGWTYREKVRDCETWKEQAGFWKGLYESERSAHQHTRDAYVLQGERQQLANEAARVSEQLLREAKRNAIPPE